MSVRTWNCACRAKGSQGNTDEECPRCKNLWNSEKNLKLFKKENQNDRKTDTNGEDYKQENP